MKFSFYLLLLLASEVYGAEVAPQVAGLEVVSSGYLLQLMSGLLFIVVLIFALAWMMKKMRLTQSAHHGLIQIVSSISVGQRDRIALIQVGDEQILVGITPGRIEKLYTLKNALKLDQKTSANESFTDKFNQLRAGHQTRVD
jgi:flagellar protein FliO/FliZ